MRRFERGIANAALSQLSYCPKLSNNRKNREKSQNVKRKIAEDSGSIRNNKSANNLPPMKTKISILFFLFTFAIGMISVKYFEKPERKFKEVWCGKSLDE